MAAMKQSLMDMLDKQNIGLHIRDYGANQGFYWHYVGRNADDTSNRLFETEDEAHADAEKHIEMGAFDDE